MMVLKKPIIGMLVLLMTINWSCQNSPKVKNETTINYLKESKEDFDQRMNWWREARFGMFIHWGVYAVPAGIHNGFKTKGIQSVGGEKNENLEILRNAGLLAERYNRDELGTKYKDLYNQYKTAY